MKISKDIFRHEVDYAMYGDERTVDEEDSRYELLGVKCSAPVNLDGIMFYIKL